VQREGEGGEWSEGCGCGDRCTGLEEMATRGLRGGFILRWIQRRFL